MYYYRLVRTCTLMLTRVLLKQFVERSAKCASCAISVEVALNVTSVKPFSSFTEQNTQRRAISEKYDYEQL